MRTFLRSRRTLAIGMAVMAIFVFLAFGAAACDWGSTPNQQQTDQNYNNDQAARLHHAVPPPHLTWSNELANQKERYIRLNRKDEVGYIYVLTYTLAYGPYQVIGKCSSTESQYSAPASVVNGGDIIQAGGSVPVVVPAAQPDGSYGQNENAIFCFLNDSQRSMVEFNGMWIWTEKPLLGLPTVPGSALVLNGK